MAIYSTYLPTYLYNAYLPTYLSNAYLHTYLPTYVPNYQTTYLPINPLTLHTTHLATYLTPLHNPHTAWLRSPIPQSKSWASFSSATIVEEDAEEEAMSVSPDHNKKRQTSEVSADETFDSDSDHVFCEFILGPWRVFFILML